MDDENQLFHRARTNANLMMDSYLSLLKTFIPNLPYIPGSNDESQPDVIKGLQIIAREMGLQTNTVRLPEPFNTTLSEPDEILRHLGNSRGIVARKVSLPEGWYHQDQGPLLVKKDGRWDVALPKSPTEYMLYNVTQGVGTPLTKEVAAAVDITAYTFYRRMPDRVVDVSSLFKWASGLCWQKDIFILLIVSLLVGFIPTITPLLVNTIFEDIIPAIDKRAHIMVVQFMLVASLGAAFTTLVRGVTTLRIKTRLRTITESALWLKLLELPASFFRQYQVGDLASRIQGISIFTVQCTSAISGGVLSGLFCIFNLALMFWYSWELALVVVLVWAIFFLLNLFFGWRRMVYERKNSEAAGLVSARLVQILSGLSQFKARAAEGRAFNLWAQLFAEQWKYKVTSRWQGTWLEILSDMPGLLLNFLIFYSVMQLMDDQKAAASTVALTSAQFISFTSAMGSFGTSVGQLLNGVLTIMQAFPSLERLEPILQQPSEISPDKMISGDLKGALRLTGVSFRYRPDSPLVLTDINMEIKPNEFVAIVGGSGSGKSTLLRIILGLDHPVKGLVEYDDKDLSQLDIASVRRQIGVVMQGSHLMGGTILTNIVGSLPLTQDDAMEAVRAVGLEEDIKDMPMGLNTIVSESGGNISGGQEQRILIARAIVNRPKIVVLDEATSALDNKTQSMVSDTLSRLSVTRIIVAHRLSTVVKADRIFVLDRGRLAEVGNYEELMAKKGLFYQLALRQIVNPDSSCDVSI